VLSVTLFFEKKNERNLEAKKTFVVYEKSLDQVERKSNNNPGGKDGIYGTVHLRIELGIIL